MFLDLRDKPHAKYQKIWVRRYFGPIYDIIKTLKLQYLFKAMCYEDG